VSGCQDESVIREIQLGTANPDEDLIYEPPSGILRLCIIGDDAHLDWEELPEPGVWTLT
jgi:hypothetical protein